MNNNTVMNKHSAEQITSQITMVLSHVIQKTTAWNVWYCYVERQYSYGLIYKKMDYRTEILRLNPTNMRILVGDLENPIWINSTILMPKKVLYDSMKKGKTHIAAVKFEMTPGDDYLVPN